MVDSSERLLQVLRGGRVAKPPLWDPWFAMPRWLHQAFQDDWLLLAAELDLAAVPLRGLQTEVLFYKPVERIVAAGVWYGGGALSDLVQLGSRPEPNWDAQLGPLMSQRVQCARAGRACWLTLNWCFEAISTSMGLEAFCLACYDQPCLVNELMQWVERRNRQAIEGVIAKVRPDFVLLDADCAYKTGLMVRPDTIRELCLEPTRATLALLADLDLPVVFHTDGKLDDVVPLVRELGLSTIHGCENAANDLDHLVESFGDHVALCGNLGPNFMARATPQEVRQRTLEVLACGARKQRFVASCSTHVPDLTPSANYRAFAGAVREFGGG